MKIIVILAMLVAFSTVASAAPAKNPVLQKFEAEGGKVEYIGTAYGLDGWVVVNTAGDVRYAYTTPEGAMVNGMLFAPDGTVETMKQVKAYQARLEGSQETVSGAEKSSSKSEQLYTSASNANWVGLGSKDAPYLYVFMNTGCPHCQDFWKDLEEQVKAGKLQVRFVPYGSSPENKDGGAALLSAADPLATWEKYLAGDKEALAKDKATPEGIAKLEANNKTASAWKFGLPPFSVYRRPADGQVMAVSGRPENKLLLLSEFLK